MSKFQSTRPVWGATHAFGHGLHTLRISIHAPRVGRDVCDVISSLSVSFQSTRPVWGATITGDEGYRAKFHFNPRAPCGARQQI